MKKLIVLIVLAMLIVLLVPRGVHASPPRVVGSYCRLNMHIEGKADCDSYRWVIVRDQPEHSGLCVIKSTRGLGSQSWGSKTQVGGHQITIFWKATGSGSGEPYKGTAPMIYKSDWCDPITGKKLKGPGGGGSRSVSLPKRQPYLLLDDGKMWCYTMTKTPILGDAEEAWCQLGTVPEGINDFCLQPNYQDLFGCMLENYNVRYPSYEQLIHYYCG